MTLGDVQKIVRRYVDAWNRSPDTLPLWVTQAKPGQQIPVPGVVFGSEDAPVAGVEFRVRAQMVVINETLPPEEQLATFLHQFGRACYRREHPDDYTREESEAEAIRYCLAALEAEGLPALAYREAYAFKMLARDEPYKSAVAKLAQVPIWRKYAGPNR